MSINLSTPKLGKRAVGQEQEQDHLSAARTTMEAPSPFAGHVSPNHSASEVPNTDDASIASDLPSKRAPPARLKTRATSNTLLSTEPIPATTSRKSRLIDTGPNETTGQRASSSMPPPATKPIPTYKPPTSRRPSAVKLSEDISAKKIDMEEMNGEKLDWDKTPHMVGQGPSSSAPGPLALPEALIPTARLYSIHPGEDPNRLSASSLHSTSSGVLHSVSGASAAPSASSSNAGSVRSGRGGPSHPLSPSLGSSKADAAIRATTATDAVSITTLSHSALPDTNHQVTQDSSDATRNTDVSSNPSSGRNSHNADRSRSRTQHRPSGSTAASSASPSNSERATQRRETEPAPELIGKIGVCALDVKARSKPSRNILTRLQSKGDFEVVVFGDKVILDEDVENWPICDFLLSFFSDGFPLDKAIAYAALRKPFCINDLPMQKVLWDRRLCLRILDSMGVPTPKRLEVNRDGGPILESPDLAAHVFNMSGVKLDGPEDGIGGGASMTKKVTLADDGDAIVVDGVVLKKPFVEKPVSGEDHNVRIYFPASHHGGGGRKLFRKIGNKSSEWDPNLKVPRAIEEEGSSYIYEQFLHVDNAEDVKAYTVGPDYCHAETRKSPVVDGLVRRNTHGKEIRYITSLTKEEATMAAKITRGFGQRICGFDLLRADAKSYVIDVNGWSFVKDNNEYYDRCSTILKQIFMKETQPENPSLKESISENIPEPSPVPRRETASHRSVLGTLLRSPSLSRLTGSHHGQRVHGSVSPSASDIPNPVHLPPTSEKLISSEIPSPADTTISSASNPKKQPVPATAPLPASKHSWKLKGTVAVIRHADRTPKQKFKFTFHTQPFIDLLKGHQEEVLLKGEIALRSVQDAVQVALAQGIEDPEKLKLLRSSLARKGAWVGTKVQIKPMFRKRTSEESIPSKLDDLSSDQATTSEPSKDPSLASSHQPRKDSVADVTLSRFSAVEDNLILDKLQLIVKWGGEPTHSARYQSQDVGENMRSDILLMNKDVLNDVSVFTSSERRVSTSAQIWAASFLNQKEISQDAITVRKDLLDDSNAAKDVMDKVKKKLKLLLREGHQAPSQFAWPSNMPEPYIVVKRVTQLMRFHQKVLRHNFDKLYGGAAASLAALKSGDSSVANSPGSLSQVHTMSTIQARWCCGEDPDLFKERWEKLFAEFCDSDKVDPSKVSELYDTMKFDALHNRQFLEWVFTPTASMLEEESSLDVKSAGDSLDSSRAPSPNHERRSSNDPNRGVDKSTSNNFAHRMGIRRRSANPATSPPSNAESEFQGSYFKLYKGTGESKAKQDTRLQKLRELYHLGKVLFDFVGPQEYGIEDSEKLEIGLLTSLPLLKEIVRDLEEVQASDDAKSFIYFTKESHIYTLLNCILEGGIKTKIERNAIPELDYLSQICFELFESEDKDADTFTYSIQIKITPGCHTFDPLDVQLDSKHSIVCAPRRSLTAHGDWKEVIETLRAKFHTVKLPKSFLAVNVSDKHAKDVKASTDDDTD